MSTDRSTLIAFVADSKTLDDAEKFLKNEGVQILSRWEVMRAFGLKVPDELSAAWREELLLSGYFEDVDFS
jgi:hypothetical protein